MTISAFSCDSVKAAAVRLLPGFRQHPRGWSHSWRTSWVWSGYGGALLMFAASRHPTLRRPSLGVEMSPQRSRTLLRGSAGKIWLGKAPQFEGVKGMWNFGYGVLSVLEQVDA